MSDLGTIEQRDGRITFRYERRLRHPPEAVWQALTDPAEIERWTGSRPELDPQPGGQYVTYHGTGDRVVDRILRIQPPRLLEHTFWVHVNPSAVVTWGISPIQGGCLLTLTHGLDLDDIRAAAATIARGDDEATILSRNAAGWHRLLDRLEASLGGRAVPWSPADQRALQQRYAALLT